MYINISMNQCVWAHMSALSGGGAAGDGEKICSVTKDLYLVYTQDLDRYN
jgi:hypothetical protein